MHMVTQSHSGMVKASISDAVRLSEKMLEILVAYPDHPKLVPRLMLWGPPGIGKSHGIKGIC
ncbi:MAG: ATP-binding protein, partial [Rectinema sp.]|nr:ATP-binding protein [Rectinema sp.]